MDGRIVVVFSKICRACMDTKNCDMISLSSFRADMFTACTEIKISPDDNLPQQICPNCANILSDMITFKQQCLSSDFMLRQFLEAHPEEVPKLEDTKPDISEAESQEKSKISHNGMFQIDPNLPKEEIEDHQYEDNLYQDDDDLPLITVYNSSFLRVKRKHKRKSRQKLKRKKAYKIKQILIESESIEKYDCGICRNEFDTFDDLAVHLDVHKSDTICNICEEQCIDWPHLLTHSQEHVKRRVLICYICKKKIMSLQAIEFHIRIKHLGEKDIKCKLCNRAFTTLRYLKKHMVVHSELKPFTCTQCPKKFKTMQLLRNHQRMHDNEKKYICEECGFSCNFSTGLRCHIQRKHSIGVFTCRICSKEFTNKETRADHERTHKKYVCAECGKSFNRMGMVRHARTHANERPYACDFCSARFGAASTLANHRRRHTGERPYKCKVCSNAFHTQNVLIKHVRIHTGEKPYVCRVCGKAFTGGHNLKVHMKVHGEKLIVSKKPHSSDDDANN